jgi:hypothetical protein
MIAKNELKDLLSGVESLIGEASALCFMTRDRGMQESWRATLLEKTAEVAQHRKGYAQADDNDAANACLATETLVACMASELAMWVSLKDDDADAAWNHLVDAQNALGAAVAAHEIVSEYAGYMKHLEALEDILFPHQVFMSPGMIVTKTICSICNNDYASCEHVVGRAYMGEFCVRILYPDELLEVSVVDRPRDKRARVMTISDGDSKRDVMTWRVVPEARGS